MTQTDAIDEFRNIYPEKEVYINSCTKVNDKYLIYASFSDGDFYFIVTSNTVSCGYNTKEEALRRG